MRRHLRRLTAALLLAAACRTGPPSEAPSPGPAATARSAAELYRDAYASLDHGHFEQAEALAAAAERAPRRSGGDAPDAWALRVLRAEIQGRQRRNREALALLESGPPSSATPEIKVRAAVTAGLARCRLARNDAAAHAAGRELDAARREADQAGSARLVAHVLVSHSACAAERGGLREAERLARGALAAARRAHATLEELTASGMLSYVRLHEGRFDEAAEWARRARESAMALGNDLLLAKANGNLARSYALSGQVERALPLLEDNVRLARRSAAYEATLLVELINMGDAYNEAGARDKAGQALREAAQLAERRGDPANLARASTTLGLLALDGGDIPGARSAIERALRLKLAAGDENGAAHARVSLARVALAGGRLPEAASILGLVLTPRTALRHRLEASALLADVRAAERHPAAAEVAFLHTAALVEQSRDALDEPSSRIAFVSKLGEFYDAYVAFLVSRGRVRQALDVADRSRARLLLERLGERRAATRSAGPGQFQRLAQRTGSVLLSYWLAPKQSYLWAVTGTSLELHTLPGQDELCRDVDAYQALVQSSRDPLDERHPAGRRLYDTLVGPVAGRLPRGSRALLVLDGCLHQLNFETLLPPDAPPRYWIEDVTLSVAPSLGSLEPAANAPLGPRERSLLALGAALAAGADFPPLAQAERELESIAALFPRGQATTLAGAAARPDAYAAAHPERFALVHFAAHATANRDSPLDSAVILSPQGDDYKLYARDVMKIPLRADVVTLSACHSAGARAYAGEGLVGLAWAFLSAGARHVVAGLWNVEDASTADLMSGLYGGLLDGRDVAEALRAAKLVLLRSPTAYRKPFYWAPFMVYTRATPRRDSPGVRRGATRRPGAVDRGAGTGCIARAGHRPPCGPTTG